MIFRHHLIHPWGDGTTTSASEDAELPGMMGQDWRAKDLDPKRQNVLEKNDTKHG